jgi:hypothetical protein
VRVPPKGERAPVERSYGGALDTVPEPEAWPRGGELPRPVVLSHADGGGDSNGELEVSSPFVLSIFFLSFFLSIPLGLGFLYRFKIDFSFLIQSDQLVCISFFSELDLHTRSSLALIPMIEILVSLGSLCVDQWVMFFWHLE